MSSGDIKFEDYEMPDVPRGDSGQSNARSREIEDLKVMLGLKFDDLDSTIAASVATVTMELQNQIKTIQEAQGEGTIIKGVKKIVSVMTDSDSEDWEKRYQKLQGQFEDFKVEHERTRNEKDRQIRDLEAGFGKTPQNSTNTQDLEKRLISALQRNQVLDDQVAKFRGMILNRSTASVQNVPDTQIIDAFNDIRTRIQLIVHHFYSTQLPRVLKGSPKEQLQFFDQLQGNTLSKAEFGWRMREKIFELLCDGILCRAIFGLDDVSMESTLEEGLKSFEVALGDAGKDHEADIAEWRSRTVMCATWLRSGKSKRPEHVSRLIDDFMAPVVPRKLDKEKRTDLDMQLLELCRAAFDLTLLWRGFKDVYRCEHPRFDSVLDEEEADQRGSEGSSDPTRAPRIAVVLSGVLVKYPEHGSQDRLVLVKAHVITRG